MEICNGNTGHAEVVQLIFDETIISFNELLFIFFKTHNPTTLNRQGNDVGSQYRSVIFYENEDQKTQIEQMIAALTQQHIFDKPIITEVVAATEFYEAEDYHQKIGRASCRERV